MSIGFVIVTYNSERVLPTCLKSIPQGYDTVVIDNASKDNSAQIASSLGARIAVNAKNLGFGTACNQGAKILSASHVFFLNPDAVLAQDALCEIEKAIELFPDAGGFGPAIVIAGKRQKFRRTSYVQSLGRRYAMDIPPNENTEVDFLDGAAFICDRKLFLELDGFDQRLFLYFDDDDLCFRIRNRNIKLIYVPGARVFHQRNGSSGKSLSLNYLRSYHATKSRLLISNKYGIPINLGWERKRAIILVLRSIAALNVVKASKSLGSLFALNSSADTPQH
jgi:N-acetylglucosaminyl-diphospho-decaprenol L-rhamnosyltransferase